MNFYTYFHTANFRKNITFQMPDKLCTVLFEEQSYKMHSWNGGSKETWSKITIQTVKIFLCSLFTCFIALALKMITNIFNKIL